MRTGLFAIVGVLFLVIGISPAYAQVNYAILVGASKYPNLDEKYWLKGPRNDVDLVARYLIEQSPMPFAKENVALLADGLEGGTAPTLAVIRKAFSDLTDKVKPGDFVYLHFSGHGTQAPELVEGSELDGLDELFLPVDIGKWDNKTGAVENALVDDEVGVMLDRLRAKGAEVWIVFDNCFSGTATRAAPTGDDEVRLRKLDPTVLGISQAALDAAETKSRALPDARTRPENPIADVANTAPRNTGDVKLGGLIAFFAAQTNETTPEKRMPKGEVGRRSQGVFTYVLFETLAQNPGITYRQLGQEVLRRYSTRNLARATPMFEGELDNIVFSGKPAAPISQWPIAVSDAGLSIPAGTLLNLAAGTELMLLAAASDTPDAALGTFKVASADIFSSDVIAIAANGQAALAVADIPRGAYLRKIGTQIDFTLTVALPAPSGNAALDTKLADAISLLQDSKDLGPRIRLVPAGSPADIRLTILPESSRPDAVWMLPSSGFLEEGSGNKTPSISMSDKDVDELGKVMGENFTAMAQALNLLKIGAGFSASELGVEVTLRTRNKANREFRDLEPVKVPRLVPGDEIHIVAINTSDQPVDINVLYVGSDYSISHFFAGRLQPGNELKKGLLRITDAAYGRDRIVMVLTPAKPQTIVENLAFMAQSEIETTRGNTRQGMAAVFAEAGFGSVTRAAVALGGDETGPSGQILQFEIDTVPLSN